MSSIQLWSVREAVREAGWDAALERLAESGFARVEPFALHLLRDEIVPAIRRAGLATPSAHGFLGADDLDATLDVAAELRVETVFHPHIGEDGWRDAASIAETALLLRTAADRASARGIRVGFHNHEFEFLHDVDGQPAFWALIEQLPADIAVEYDVYWAAIAGRDIVADIRRLGSRAAALHLKDGPYRAGPEDQVALGDGDLPLEEILAAAPDALAVLSFDRMPGTSADIWTAIERSQLWLSQPVRA
ncbi:sugar phosphate isomerase/epimerase [Agromyces atrinae]|uniref:sugar phosphate isomerase/epimerase family protein n=1 Tax=Agromyces atrinae TaxID=592376 RepID=UPI001F58FD98|nr:sugar phosphate isomerase/epimerase [Agromyces atrinae]MCI2956909.1 sugar phosphate isomerase/epimerase [Agromyces atrinae]